MHGSRWRGLETEHRLDKDAEVAHPTGKPTERRLRVLQPERATAPVPDPTKRCFWTRRSPLPQVTDLRASRSDPNPWTARAQPVVAFDLVESVGQDAPCARC
jgi:hypothetical protein